MQLTWTNICMMQCQSVFPVLARHLSPVTINPVQIVRSMTVKSDRLSVAAFLTSRHIPLLHTCHTLPSWCHPLPSALRLKGLHAHSSWQPSNSTVACPFCRVAQPKHPKGSGQSAAWLSPHINIPFISLSLHTHPCWQPDFVAVMCCRG